MSIEWAAVDGCGAWWYVMTLSVLHVWLESSFNLVYIYKLLDTLLLQARMSST
jgi:hypothetical protein